MLIIRPDVAVRYDFDALKAGYSNAHKIQPGDIETINSSVFSTDYDEPNFEDGMEP